MLVTFTNASDDNVYVSMLYKEILAGDAVVTRRSRAELESDQALKALVAAGTIVLGFEDETGDDATVGLDSSLPSYTNALRPDATDVPARSAIWNSDDNAPNWSDGTVWRDASGSIT